MRKKLKILLLEDSALDAELIKRELIKGHIDHEMLVVKNKEKFKIALKDYPADIILSDHSLPNFDSHEALRIVKEAGIRVPFILITSTMTDEFAVRVMKEGAHDYIIKDRLLRLPSAVVNSMEKFWLEQEHADERHKAGEAMKHLNNRLQLATRSAGMGVWDWDIEKDYLEWDERMYQLYHTNNYEFEAAYDAWISKLHPEDIVMVNNEMQKALNGEKKYDTEFRVIGFNGFIYTLRATGIVERNDQGKPVRMIGVNWDITTRKAAAQEREQIIDDLLHRNTELEQFAYVISHNLRVPVANIIGVTNVLSDPTLDIEDKEMLANGLNEAAVTLDNIVKDLNHILEIKSGNNETKEIVHFSALVEDIKIGLGTIIENGPIDIKYDFSEVDEFFTLKTYLYSIFYNLISNGIKYRRLRIESFIEIKSRKIGNKLELFFTDNGTGIDLQKNGMHVFGLYKRFQTDLPGKGMGLFMVKTQVQALGGKVSIKSIENEGTEFKIEFELQNLGNF